MIDICDLKKGRETLMNPVPEMLHQFEAAGERGGNVRSDSEEGRGDLVTIAGAGGVVDPVHDDE